MIVSRSSNKAMDYHCIDIDPFHDEKTGIEPIFNVSKSWFSRRGVPVWDAAKIRVHSTTITPDSCALFVQGVHVAVVEAQRLDDEFPPGTPVLGEGEQHDCS